MKKYSLCIISFAIALCLLLAGILIVTASGNDDTVQTYCVIGFNTDSGSYIESAKIPKENNVTRPDDPDYARADGVHNVQICQVCET